jgi:hypothetical protein
MRSFRALSRQYDTFEKSRPFVSCVFGGASSRHASVYKSQAELLDSATFDRRGCLGKVPIQDHQFLTGRDF